jgi:transcriptional regulator with XRE-family HTH domain
MVDRPPIGAVIREERLALGYTQAKLAALCDITPQYLSLLELGEVNVSLDTLLSISSVIGKPLSLLIARAEELGVEVPPNEGRMAEGGSSDHTKSSEGRVNHSAKVASPRTGKRTEAVPKKRAPLRQKK